jgi:hypothetical protein
MPGKQNNGIPPFIITTVRPSLQPPLCDLISPTSPGNANDPPSPLISDLDASLVPPSMILSSHPGIHLQTTDQLRDNILDKNLSCLTTHASLNCNMPGPNQTASNATP